MVCPTGAQCYAAISRRRRCAPPGASRVALVCGARDRDVQGPGADRWNSSEPRLRHESSRHHRAETISGRQSAVQPVIKLNAADIKLRRFAAKTWREFNRRASEWVASSRTPEYASGLLTAGGRTIPLSTPVTATRNRSSLRKFRTGSRARQRAAFSPPAARWTISWLWRPKRAGNGLPVIKPHAVGFSRGALTRNRGGYLRGRERHSRGLSVESRRTW